MFLGLSICLYVCLPDYSKSYERILMTFFGGPGTAQLPSDRFGGNPDLIRIQEFFTDIIT